MGPYGPIFAQQAIYSAWEDNKAIKASHRATNELFSHLLEEKQVGVIMSTTLFPSVETVPSPPSSRML